MDLLPGEVMVMARAVYGATWEHTASMLCALHNMFAKKPLRPTDFHPLYASKQTKRGSGLSIREFAEQVKGLR
jgi:hypothetical protein